jgi:primosomal protein N' (replication factor Y)
MGADGPRRRAALGRRGLSPTPPSERPIARVAVEVEPYHLDRLFDYAVGDADPVVGARVEVVFAGRVRKGVVVERVATTDVPDSRLRPLKRTLGDHVWATPDEVGLARWAADRWGGTLADVLRHALPARTVDVERRAADAGWFPAAERAVAPPAPRPEAWERYGQSGSALVDAVTDGTGAFVWRPLADDDVAARIAELVRVCLAGDRDVLVVTGDPVSPVADAVVAAAGDLAVDARAAASPRVTYRRWLQARTGYARVVVGTRSVALWPLAKPGLTIVLDEANPAHKERRSPRHHVREIALERARRTNGVALLVGTVASAATWRLLVEGRVTPVAADRQTERAAAPQVAVDDRPSGRIGRPALQALRTAVEEGSYGIVLATRRGEGRALACRKCGGALRCPTCANTIAPAGAGVLCEGCGWKQHRRPHCPSCHEPDPWVPLAAGAQRLGQELARSLPKAQVHVLEGHAADIPPAPAVLVMTRGSVLDAPPGPVGALVLPDVDALTRRPVLDADEDALRLCTTMASWVTRSGTGARGSDDAARVVVQTREPEHAVVQALVRWDPSGYWRTEAPKRAELGFPPSAHAVRIDAPAAISADVGAVLEEALKGVAQLLGPLREDGRARWLCKTPDRRALLAALHESRVVWSKSGADVRLDVDPVEVL